MSFVVWGIAAARIPGWLSKVLFSQICQLQQLRYIDNQCELTQFEYLQNHHEYLMKIIKLAIQEMIDVYLHHCPYNISPSIYSRQNFAALSWCFYGQLTVHVFLSADSLG